MKKIIGIQTGIVLLLLLLTIVPVQADDIVIDSEIEVYLLSQDPDPAERGDYVTLRWKIENIGGETAEDLQVELLPQYPFTLDPGADGTQRVGDVWRFSGTDERDLIIKYKVRVDELAEEGENEIRLRWREGSGEWATKVYDIEVEEAPDVELQVGDITTSPLDLILDSEDNSITVEVQNTGDDAAELVITEATLPEAFEVSYSGANRENLGSIAGGTSVDAVFHYDLDEDVQAGWHEGTLALSYKEEGDSDNRPTKRLELPFRVYVKPTPSFTITDVRSEPVAPMPGDTVRLFITVENTGSEKGESISLRAFKDASQPFDFTEKSDFIGTLEPGEQGEAVLELELDKDAPPKEYRIDLETRVVDGENVLVDSKTATFNVIAGTHSSLLPYVVVAVILLALLGSWWYKRKK